jgi:hypothetical protein
MAQITWGSPTQTLTNGYTGIADGVASRFANYLPFTNRVGDTAIALGTGARTMFTFRIDYGASFEMREIPNTSLDVALALLRHLQNGGVVSVDVGDGVNGPYTNCVLAPDGNVTLAMQDNVELTYTLSVSVINLNGADMLCEYATT